MLEALNAVVAPWTGLATVIATLVGALAALFGYDQALARRVQDRASELAHIPGDLEAAVARLRKADPMDHYREGLDRILAALDRAFGRGPWLLHWRGFGVMLLLAAGYCAAFSMAGLVASGDAAEQLLGTPDATGAAHAIAGGVIALNLAVTLSLAYLAGLVAFRLDAWFDHAAMRLVGETHAGWRTRVLAGSACALPAMLILAWMGTPAIGIMIVGAVLGVWPSPAVLALLSLCALQIGLEIAPLVEFFGLMAIACSAGAMRANAETRAMAPVLWSFIGYLLFLGSIAMSLLSPLQLITGSRVYFGLVVIFALLPFVNAPLDFVSLAISRGLAEHLRRRLVPGGGLPLLWLGLHLLADIVCALVLLGMLAWLLPRAYFLHPGFEHFHGMEGFSGTDAWFWVRDTACATARFPATAGLAFTLMLASTLVPTIAHVALVIASPFAHAFGRGAMLRRQLATLGEDGTIPATLRAAGALPALIARHEVRRRPIAFMQAFLIATLLVSATTAGLLWLVARAAGALAGDPGMSVTQLLLAIAYGFDAAAAQACFAVGH